MIGPITLDAKCAGARSAGNPHAACDVEGAGNGATDSANRARRGKPWIQTSACPDGLPRQLSTLPHYVHRSRRGYFVVGRRTERKRFHRKLQALSERLRSLRVHGGTAMLRYFRQHMQGHIQYYGVSGNYRQLASYAYFASRLLYKWLNRRSQRRSTDWARFRTTLHGRWLPPLCICHNLYPEPSWKTQAGSRMV